MADLKVDYSLLDSTHSALSRLIGDFDGLQASTGKYDGAMGSGDIASAMDSFAGNWSYHRNKLVENMKKLDEMVTETVKEFRKADTDQAKALTGK